MFEKVLKFPHARVIRIGLSFILFFLAINLSVYLFMPSYKQTLRASEFFLDLNICNFSDKDIDDVIDLIKTDKNNKIFLLGDSVSYGIGTAENDSISGYLRESKKMYSVYNLSVCGAKPLDYYLWINYLNKINPGEKNIYLVQYNYKWFPIKDDKLENYISQKKALYRFSEFLTQEFKDKLEFNPGWFDFFKYNIEKILPVVSNKDRLFALIFKERSKEDLIKHLMSGPVKQPTFEEKKKNFNCKIDYASSLWNKETDFNYKVYLKTLALIKEKNINAVVYLPAYNSDIIARCRDANFDINTTGFIKDAGSLNVKVFESTSQISQEYFLDDMHLNSEGNKIFSQILSQKIL